MKRRAISALLAILLILQALPAGVAFAETEPVISNTQRAAAFYTVSFVVEEGEAPAALSALPKPDAVFVGGSGGNLRAILGTVHTANPAARICVSAITIEGLHNSYTALQALSYETEVTQISVSRSKPAGGLTLMLAQNPVWLITGCAK